MGVEAMWQRTKKASRVTVLKEDAMGAYTSASSWWINCECRGIIRNNIFVTDVLTSSPEVRQVHDRVAVTQFDYNFCNK